MPRLSHLVEGIDSPLRVDKYLASLSQGPSRSQFKAGLKRLSINGREAKLSARVHSGDYLEAEWEPPVCESLIAEDIPLAVLYEDEEVLVVDKAQGMVTHPGAGNMRGTLANALLFYRGQRETQELRTGIVHRLDKDTSGVIISAKNAQSECWLQEQFRSRRVKKEYIAILLGKPKSAQGVIKTNIARDPKNRQRFRVSQHGGKAAHTRYRCIAFYGPYTLVRLRIKTGRTHQIRVHMRYLGSPVLGDPLYGGQHGEFGSMGLMLHSRLLAIRLPECDRMSEFKAPVPERFKSLLTILRSQYTKCLPE